MAGPNQDVGATLRSQEYFRLKKVIQSPGDIFELDTSAKAIYIGPDSDIGEVQLTYFNPDETLSLETAQVSVNGPFVGRIDSSVVTKVSSTGQFARILASATDLVDPTYTPPAGAFPGAQRKFNIPAVLDLIVSLRDPPDVPAVRADRTLRFPNVPYTAIADAPGGTNGSTDLIVPIYGRRMITVTVGANNDSTYLFRLVTLQPGPPTLPRNLGQLVFATGGGHFANAHTATAVIRASDAARIGATYTFASPPVQNGWYTEADQPSDPASDDQFTPIVRGMADLLIVNILSTRMADTGTLFSNVFVKVADRET